MVLHDVRERHVQGFEIAHVIANRYQRCDLQALNILASFAALCRLPSHRSPDSVVDVSQPGCFSRREWPLFRQGAGRRSRAHRASFAVLSVPIPYQNSGHSLQDKPALLGRALMTGMTGGLGRATTESGSKPAVILPRGGSARHVFDNKTREAQSRAFSRQPGITQRTGEWEMPP